MGNIHIAIGRFYEDRTQVRVSIGLDVGSATLPHSSPYAAETMLGAVVTFAIRIARDVSRRELGTGWQ